MMLFATLAMVDIGIGQNPARLYVDPDEIEGVNPCCDPFDIEIKIEDVEDLYAYGLTLSYAPYASVLVPISVTEGPFLAQGGTTHFIYKINHFTGQVKVGCTLFYPTGQGVSGDGTLVMIRYKVAEAGESSLNLVDTVLLNSNLESIEHDREHGKYKGPRVEMLNVDYKDMIKVSGKQTLNASVRKRSEACEHEPDEPPLWTFVRFDIERVEDGRRFVLTTDTHHLAKGAPYTFDPVEWCPEVEDVGTYACTAMSCFSYYGIWFNEGRKAKTFMFTVVP